MTRVNQLAHRYLIQRLVEHGAEKEYSYISHYANVILCVMQFVKVKQSFVDDYFAKL
jgi:hypothetical protein